MRVPDTKNHTDERVGMEGISDGGECCGYGGFALLLEYLHPLKWLFFMGISGDLSGLNFG